MRQFVSMGHHLTDVSETVCNIMCSRQFDPSVIFLCSLDLSPLLNIRESFAFLWSALWTAAESSSQKRSRLAFGVFYITFTLSLQKRITVLIWHKHLGLASNMLAIWQYFTIDNPASVANSNTSSFIKHETAPPKQHSEGTHFIEAERCTGNQLCNWHQEYILWKWFIPRFIVIVVGLPF